MAEDPTVRVAVNGYSVIGKRVANAVAGQDDMALVGVSDIVFDYRIRVAAERGYPIYASASDKRPTMEQAGIPAVGTLDDLLRQADVVVDCTPKGIGAKNKPIYEQAGVKAIFQGGEQHELTGFSFTAQVNYGEALNRRYTRVVACNTTALRRLMHAFEKRGWIKRARAVPLRRATDPWESHKNGMINTAVPETKVPSHQGTDAQTVIKGLDITTMAGTGPYNLSHLHYAIIETTRPISLDELRHALWEVAVWEDALASDGRELYLTYQVDNEAIAIPENIDAIRAMCGSEADGARSIEKTNQSLGIVKSLFPKIIPEEAVHAEMGKALAVAEREFMAEGFKGAEEPTQAVSTTAQRG